MKNKRAKNVRKGRLKARRMVSPPKKRKVVIAPVSPAAEPELRRAAPEEEPYVLSGGTFHGAPLALAFDTAAIALTPLAGIAERRIDRLVNPDLNQGLPAFLAAHPGLGSGFMIGHVAAVSLLNECKVLAHPASVDNVPTSGGQEDHVSMGMTAALKLRTIVENGEYIAAVEL